MVSSPSLGCGSVSALTSRVSLTQQLPQQILSNWLSLLGFRHYSACKAISTQATLKTYRRTGKESLSGLFRFKGGGGIPLKAFFSMDILGGRNTLTGLDKTLRTGACTCSSSTSPTSFSVGVWSVAWSSSCCIHGGTTLPEVRFMVSVGAELSCTLLSDHYALE